MKNRIPLMLSLIAAALFPQSGNATEGEDETGRAVFFRIGTGLEYDSKVAVLELDTTANAGDTAALFDLGVGYDNVSSERLDLKAGYYFSQTLHEAFSDFDVRIHRGSATIGYDFNGFNAGTILQYARAELDGETFLTLKQASPYVSTVLGRRLFLRFSFAHSDKDFAGNPQRAATADALSSDVYVFIDGLRTYLAFGYRYDSEDAIDEQFDYTGNRFRAQLSRRLALGSRELTLKAYLRFEDRDYEKPTLSIGERRRDDRSQLEVLAEVPMTERVLGQIGYKYADNRSNLPSVDFDENVFSLKLVAEF